MASEWDRVAVTHTCVLSGPPGCYCFCVKKKKRASSNTHIPELKGLFSDFISVLFGKMIDSAWLPETVVLRELKGSV